jgi:ABC-type transporter Mla subunit MlaD
VCQAAAALRDSVSTLTHVNIGTGTVSEIISDLGNVQAKLTALTAELHDTFKTQTNAVTSALDTLKTAASNLRAHPSASTITSAATAVGGVTAAVSSLLTSLGPRCGSASASPSPAT